jgi:acetolactate synthase-1/2/3 large subunit
MRVVDRVFKTLSDRGCKYAAGVAGGGIMFLVDALKKNKSYQLQFFHHEQSAAFAAEAFARATSTLPVCFATIGPGVTNVLSGAFSCFINSVPCFIVTGAKRSNVETHYGRERFRFPQDCNSAAIAQGVVKQFYELKIDDDIARVVNELANTALSGRPGPVWLSIPLDVQASAQSNLPTQYFPGNYARVENKSTHLVQEQVLNVLATRLQKSVKPLLIVGHGIERICWNEPFKRFLRTIGLPVVTSIGANHLINASEEMSLGVFGPTGRRAANRVMLEADLLIGLGFRFTPDTIGFDQNAFFGKRPVIVLTDDPEFELPENVESWIFHIRPEELPLEDMMRVVNDNHPHLSRWVEYTKIVNATLTTELEVSLSKSEIKVDPYFFSDIFLKYLEEEIAIAGGISLEIVALSNSMSFKKRHEFYVSSHAGQLGWDLPAAIGLAHTGRYKAVVCFTGDGSLMFNLQEIATLARVSCGATIFVIDNSGYNSIRTTQETHLNRVYVGSTLDDLAFPDWHYLAKAFGFLFQRISSNDDVQPFLENWNQSGKYLVQVMVDPDRGRTPRLVSSIKDGKFVTPRLDEQFPALSDAVLNTLNRAKLQLDNEQ